MMVCYIAEGQGAVCVSFIFNKLHFFYKHPVYKQLALGWQIAKQLSGLQPLPLSNKKNYRLKKSGFSLYDKGKIAVKSISNMQMLL